MDAIGDLLMVGYPIIGHVVLHKAGHDVMHGFVEKIIASTDSYRFIELANPMSFSKASETLYGYPRFG